jgi:predicted transcriptional regulator of viral defense system
MEISNEIIKRFHTYPVFTYRDVELFLKGKTHVGTHVARSLSYLKSRGRIFTVKKGFYATVKDSSVSGFAHSPFYYGLLFALTIRGMWTQHSKPEIMTVGRIRSSKEAIFGDKTNVVFLHHVPIKYFFGFDAVKHGNFTVPVSDPEKTLIDLFYYRKRLSIQNYSGLLMAVNVSKLNRYLKRYDSHTIAVVKNFIKKHKHSADSKKLESPY